jgi:ribose 5-phosphate isomerase B
MKIALGSDHRGFEVKRRIATVLQQLGHEVQDVGPHSKDSVDYPDYAFKVALAVSDGGAQRGVLICGTGIGMCIAANKVKGVRAAVCHDSFSARQSREDDDANVICLGERVIGMGLALELIDRFLSSSFSGAERHRRRLDKVLALEAAFGAPEGDVT